MFFGIFNCTFIVVMLWNHIKQGQITKTWAEHVQEKSLKSQISHFRLLWMCCHKILLWCSFFFSLCFLDAMMQSYPGSPKTDLNFHKKVHRHRLAKKFFHHLGLAVLCMFREWSLCCTESIFQLQTKMFFSRSKNRSQKESIKSHSKKNKQFLDLYIIQK